MRGLLPSMEDCHNYKRRPCARIKECCSVPFPQCQPQVGAGPCSLSTPLNFTHVIEPQAQKVLRVHFRTVWHIPWRAKTARGPQWPFQGDGSVQEQRLRSQTDLDVQSWLCRLLKLASVVIPVFEPQNPHLENRVFLDEDWLRDVLNNPARTTWPLVDSS